LYNRKITLYVVPLTGRMDVMLAAVVQDDALCRRAAVILRVIVVGDRACRVSPILSVTDPLLKS
jgi:hypothetical protein